MGHRWGFVTSKMAAILTASIQECDVYCLCGQGKFREMIACDSPGCPLTWFHMECVGLANVPVGKWICCVCQGVYIQMFIILYHLPEHLCCPCLYYTMTSNAQFICVFFLRSRGMKDKKKRRSLIVNVAFVILKVLVKLKPRFDHMLSC